MPPDPHRKPEQLVHLLNLGLITDPEPSPPSSPGPAKDEDQPVADPPAVAPPAADPAAVAVAAGTIIGRYRLLEVIGQGGFGIVWRAELIGPLHREVALKLIRPGMDSREIIARFESERQALSLMDHPNIAAVLDAGTTATGQPYFVMELVRGARITDYCDGKRLTIRERLDLFVKVCCAVQHAHQKAVLHRDLKPSNILVVEADGQPVPKIIDFGVAKALTSSPEVVLECSLTHTSDGMIVGTPQYMSPEQAGSMSDVDTRSDVFTLGVVLHELLIGSPPLKKSTMRASTMDGVLAKVRDQDVTAPSSVLTVANRETTTAARARQCNIPGLRRQIRGELDWVSLKAMEKDRDRRYQTAADLGADVQRYLDNEPVEAGNPGRIYRLRHFMRRHRPMVIAVSAVGIAVVAGLAFAARSYLNERQAFEKMVAAQGRLAAAEAAAKLQAVRSGRLADFLLKTLKDLDPKFAKGRDASVMREFLMNINRQRKDLFADDPVSNARLAFAVAQGDQQFAQKTDRLDSFAEALRLLRAAGLGETADAATCLYSMATSLNAISAAAGYEGDRHAALEQCRDWYAESLRLRRSLTSPTNAGAIRALSDYGQVLIELGMTEEGTAAQSEAVRLARKNGSPAMMSHSLNSQAGVALRKGDPDAALSLAQKALKELEGSKSAAGSQETARAYPEVYRRLYSVHMLRKEFGAAGQAANNLLEFRREQLGYEPPDTLVSLGTALSRNGETDKATDAFRRALVNSSIHEHHPYPEAIVKEAVRHLVRAKDLPAAERILGEAIDALAGHPGSNDSDLKFARDRLAELHPAAP